MPSLDSIVATINTTFETNGFKSRRFQGSLYLGISDPVKTLEKEEDNESEFTVPCIIDNEGECKEVSFDDNYPLVVFHRVVSADYKVDDQDYGPTGTTMLETANMKLIIAGNRKRTQVRQEDVMASVIMDFPKEIKSATVQPLGMNSLVIEVGQINNDKYAVWDEHWKGKGCDLPPNIFLFSVDYKIIDTYNKSCFDLCQ